MDFPERVSQEDYERYCGRSLRLFLSVDIVNSTALKQEFRERDGSWLGIARSFYTAFPTFLTSALDELPAIDEASKPNLWKAIGDELVFVSDLERMEAIPTLLRALRSAVNRWNCDHEDERVLVKGGAWLAGFPVMNSIIPGEAEGRHDYIGSSIDTGFRLCRFASPRELVIGVEIAYVIARLNDPLVAELHYRGRHEIRGVLKGRPYPVFWLDCFAAASGLPKISEAAKRDDEVAKREEGITGQKSVKLEAGSSVDFITEWVDSTTGEIQLPFPPNGDDPRFPAPSDYDAWEQTKREEFERVYLPKGDPGGSEGDEAPHSETEPLLAKLKGPRKV